MEKKSDTFNFLDIPRQEPVKKKIEQRRRQFAEIAENYQANEAAVQASRCIDCGNPYCQWQCPLHNYIPNWLDLVARGELVKAFELAHSTNTLPEVCGRVCPQDRLCEGACTLATGFGAVTIGSVEKYIADKAMEAEWLPDLSHVKPSSQRVAIIGAGPAGLGCADILIRHGINPTIYDRHPEIGGLLTFGIPDFKLEKTVMTKRRQYFERLGAEFILNTEIGQAISFTEIEQQYDAVFMGLGAYAALCPDFAQQKRSGVSLALDYLIGNNRHSQGLDSADYQNLAGKKVVVLGGGDTAMDCVRSAIRQQAERVSCLYRRDDTAMPGSRREVQYAKEEGVQFHWHLQPDSFLGTQQLEAVRCYQTYYDKAGQLQTDKSQSHDFEADVVLIAFGFAVEPAAWFDSSGISSASNGCTVVGSSQTKYRYQTSHPKVFAAGDMISGAALVVDAIAGGREAALDIVQYLQ